MGVDVNSKLTEAKATLAQLKASGEAGLQRDSTLACRWCGARTDARRVTGAVARQLTQRLHRSRAPDMHPPSPGVPPPLGAAGCGQRHPGLHERQLGHSAAAAGCCGGRHRCAGGQLVVRRIPPRAAGGMRGGGGHFPCRYCLAGRGRAAQLVAPSPRPPPASSQPCWAATATQCLHLQHAQRAQRPRPAPAGVCRAQGILLLHRAEQVGRKGAWPAGWGASARRHARPRVCPQRMGAAARLLTTGTCTPAGTRSIGAAWLGLIISCSFALLLLFFAFIWVGRWAALAL